MKRIMNIFPTAHQRLYPFDFYLQMRRLYPVVYDEHSNIWGIFRYGDVQRVLGDYMTFSSAPQTSDSPISSSNDRDASALSASEPAAIGSTIS